MATGKTKIFVIALLVMALAFVSTSCGGGGSSGGSIVKGKITITEISNIASEAQNPLEANVALVSFNVVASDDASIRLSSAFVDLEGTLTANVAAMNNSSFYLVWHGDDGVLDAEGAANPDDEVISVVAGTTWDSVNSTVTFTFPTTFTMPKGDSQNFTVRVEFNADDSGTNLPTPGQTLFARLTNLGGQTTGGFSITKGFIGDIVTGDGQTVDPGSGIIIFGTMTVETGADNADGTADVVNTATVTDSQFELNINATYEAITVSTISIDNAGTINAEVDITPSNCALGLDTTGDGQINTLIKTGATIVGQTITFSGFSRSVAAGTNEDWVFTIALSGSASANETLILRFDDGSSMTAVGDLSAESITVALDGDEDGSLDEGAADYVTGTASTIFGAFDVASIVDSNLADGLLEYNDADASASAANTIMTLNVPVLTEDVDVTSFSINFGGNVDPGDIANVEIWTDTDGDGDTTGETMIGNNNTFGAASTVTITVSNQGANENRITAAGANEDFLVAIELNGGAVGGENSTCTLTNISGTGVTTGTAISSGTLAVASTTSKEMIGLFSVNTTSLTQAITAIVDATGTEMFRVNLVASGSNTAGVADSGENMNVSEISFDIQVGVGTFDEVAHIDNLGWNVYLDGGDLALGGDDTLLSAVGLNASGNNGSITISLAGTLIVPAGDTALLFLTADLDGTATGGDTFIVQLTDATDVTTTGVSSSEAITETGFVVDNKTLGNGVEIVGIFGAVIDGGDKDSNIVFTDNDADNTDINTVMKVTIPVIAEDIDLTSISLDFTGTLTYNTDIGNVEVWTDANNDGDTTGETKISTDTTVAADGTVTVTLSDQGSNENRAAADGTTDEFIVVVELNGAGAGGETLSVTVTGVAGTTATTGQAATTGVLAVVSTTEKTLIGALSVDTVGLTQPIRADFDGADQHVFSFNLKADDGGVGGGEDVDVTAISFDAIGSIVGFYDEDDDVNVGGWTVYLDDGDGTFNGGDVQQGAGLTITGGNNGDINFATPLTVTAGATTTLHLVVSMDIEATAEDGEEVIINLVSTDVTIFGADTNVGLTATGVFPITNNETTDLEIVGDFGVVVVQTDNSGFIEYDDSNTTDTAVNSVMVFRLPALAGSIDLNSITLDFSASSVAYTDISDIEIWTDSNGGVDGDTTLETEISSNVVNVPDVGDGTVTIAVADTPVPTNANRLYVTGAGNQDLIVAVKLNSTAQGGETITCSITALTGTAVASNLPVSQTVLAYASATTLTVKGKLSITVGATQPTKALVNGDEQEMFQMNLIAEGSATAGEDIRVTQLDFNINGGSVGAFHEIDDVNDLGWNVWADDGNGTFEGTGTDTLLSVGGLNADAEGGVISWVGTHTVTAGPANASLIFLSANMSVPAGGAGIHAAGGEDFNVEIDANAEVTAIGVLSTDAITATGGVINNTSGIPTGVEIIGVFDDANIADINDLDGFIEYDDTDADSDTVNAAMSFTVPVLGESMDLATLTFDFTTSTVDEDVDINNVEIWNDPNADGDNVDGTKISTDIVITGTTVTVDVSAYVGAAKRVTNVANVGSTEDFIVSFELSGTGLAGATVTCTLTGVTGQTVTTDEASATGVLAVASTTVKTLIGKMSVASTPADQIDTALLNGVTQVIGVFDFTAAGSGTSAENMNITNFSFDSLAGITVDGFHEINDVNATGWRLYRDDSIDGTGTFAAGNITRVDIIGVDADIDNGVIVFVTGNLTGGQVTVDAGETARLYLTASMDTPFGVTYATPTEDVGVQLTVATDLTIAGATSGQAITATAAAAVNNYGADNDGVTITGAFGVIADGGSLTADIEFDDATISTTENTVMWIDIPVETGEDINLTELVLDFSANMVINTTTIDLATDVTSIEIWQDIIGLDGSVAGEGQLVTTSIVWVGDVATVTFDGIAVNNVISNGVTEGIIVAIELNGQGKGNEDVTCKVTGLTGTGVTTGEIITEPNIGVANVGSTTVKTLIGKVAIDVVGIIPFAIVQPTTAQVNGATELMFTYHIAASGTNTGGVADTGENMTINSIVHDIVTGAGIVGTFDEAGDVDANGWNVWRDFNNNGTFESTVDTLLTTTNPGEDASADNGTITLLIADTFTVAAGDTATLFLTASMDGTATATATHTFEVQIANGNMTVLGELSGSGITATGGTIDNITGGVGVEITGGFNSFDASTDVSDATGLEYDDSDGGDYILATCGVTAASTTVVVADTSLLVVGMDIDVLITATGATGTGVVNTPILTIPNGTTFTIGGAITTDATYSVYLTGAYTDASNTVMVLAIDTVGEAIDLDTITLDFTGSTGAFDADTDITNIEIWRAATVATGNTADGSAARLTATAVTWDTGTITPEIVTITGIDATAGVLGSDNQMVQNPGAPNNLLIVVELAGTGLGGEFVTCVVTDVGGIGAVTGATITATSLTVPNATSQELIGKLSVDIAGYVQEEVAKFNGDNQVMFGVNFAAPGTNDGGAYPATATSGENISVTGLVFDSLAGTVVGFEEVIDVNVLGWNVWLDDGDGAFSAASDTLVSTTGPGITASGADGDIVLADAFTVVAGTSQRIFLTADMSVKASAVPNEDFRVEVDSATDVTSVGVNSGIALVETGVAVDNDGTVNALNGVEIVGTLTIANGANNPTASDIHNNMDNIILQQFNVTALAENFDTISIDFTLTSTASDDTDVDATVDIYEDANGDGVLDGGDNAVDLNNTFVAGAVTIPLTGETVVAGALNSVDYIVVVDLGAATFATDEETFALGIAAAADATGNGVTSGQVGVESTLTGTIVGGTKTVRGFLQMIDNGPVANTDIRNDNDTDDDLTADRLMLLDFNMVSRGDTLEVTALTFTDIGTTADADMTVYLYQDNGVAGFEATDATVLASGTHTAGSITFDLSGAPLSLTNVDPGVGTGTRYFLVYEMMGLASTDETCVAVFPNTTNVTVTSTLGASTTALKDSFATTSGTLTIKPFIRVSDGGNAQATATLIQPNSDATAAAATDGTAVLLHLKVENPTSAGPITISTIDFDWTGTGADDADITDVDIKVDNAAGGAFDLAVDTTEISNAGSAPGSNDAVNDTITLTGGRTIAASTTEYWWVVVEYAGAASDLETFVASLSDITDLAYTATVLDYAAGFTAITSPGNEVRVLSNAVATPISAAGLTSFDTPQFSVTGDFNNDGNMDIMATRFAATSAPGSSNSAVILYLGDGDGTFTVSANINSFDDVDTDGAGSDTSQLGAKHLVAGDFDNNGNLDVAWTNQGTGDLSVILLDHALATCGVTAASTTVVVTDTSLLEVGMVVDVLVTATGATGTGVIGATIATIPNATTFTIGGAITTDGTYSVYRTTAYADVVGAVVTVKVDLDSADGFSQGITSGDFDSDGWIDLAITMPSKGRIQIFLNDGAGAFVGQAPIDTEFAANPWAIAATDVNSDGALDLLVTYNTASNISIYLNDGSATFTAAATPLAVSGVGFTYLTVADVVGSNGTTAPDGRADIIISNPLNDKVEIYPSAASATDPYFTAAGGSVPISLTLAVTNPTDVQAFDADEDGDLDLVVAFDDTADQLSLFLSNGTGTFTEHEDRATGDDPASINVADFDGDGHEDLFVLEANTVSVFLENQPTYATPGYTAVDTAGNGDAIDATLADLNNDGFLDLIVNDSSDGEIEIYLNDGTGAVVSGTTPYNFVGGADVTLTWDGNFHFVVTTGDLNGDGFLDVIASDSATDIEIFYNDINGDGVGGDFTGTSDDSLSGIFTDLVLWYGIIAADFDNDGDVDIIGMTDASTVEFVRNNGDGTFTAAGGWGTLPPIELNYGDFDNDGDLDLIYLSTDRFEFYENDGAGNFGAVAAVAYLVDDAVAVDAVACTVADFNGDGWLDVAVLDDGDGDVEFFANNGDGTFAAAGITAATLFNGPYPETTMSAVDFDRDGDMDVVIGGGFAANFEILENPGNGNFVGAVVANAGATEVEIILVGDINNSGEAEVIGLDESDVDISILVSDRD